VPNSFAQDASPEYVVRVIYVVPNDREPDPDIDRKLDTLMKEAQQFYADLMEFHGFSRKTFRLETNATGNVMVHHVNGKFNHAYYQNPSTGSWIVWDEIEEQLDISKNIYLLALDTDHLISGGRAISGIAYGESHSGKALVPTSHINVALHEIGHAFGLAHDNRVEANRWINPVSSDPMITSFCAAEWLDVHRYFNSTQEGFNDVKPSVQMLAPSLASPPYTIRLQFEITDPDGLHQAQLFGLGDPAGVIACKKLDGKKTTLEFITADLTDLTPRIHLRLIDVYGNFTGHTFPIDMGDLLQPGEIISIPDPNLASAVRETLGLALNDTITQLVMLRLTRLSASNRQISDLTGLEHALNIQSLNFRDNEIRDITPLAGLTKLTRLDLWKNPINDITPLAKFKNLTHLDCAYTQISDITPLAMLTNLRELYLIGNPISDITPLAGLTGLSVLSIGSSQEPISDITPLEGLVILESLGLFYASITDIRLIARFRYLTSLNLYDVPISDISPLTRLTKLRLLWLRSCKISDVSPLAGLKNLKVLSLNNNQITDVSPLAELVNLKELRLVGNPIKNRKPLFDLLRKNLDVKIYLIPGFVPLLLPTSQLPEDVNADGVINILDLTLVASNFGEQGENIADVNGDGTVDILDLVQVAAAFGNTTSTP
jgi:Leucine-rich repeat (LRR) protein